MAENEIFGGPEYAEYERAAQRVERALGQLDASLRGLNGRIRSINRIESEVKRLEQDRAMLAGELGRALSKAERIDASASQVSRRLVGVMEDVKSVLEEED